VVAQSQSTERVGAIDATTDGASAEVPSLPQLSEEVLAVPLADLALEARAPGASGTQALTRLHTALATLQPTDANGAALLKLLDDGVLGELKSDDGTSSRLVGIEALLRLGYPWAVQIRPEDLQWYRDAVRARLLRRWAVVGAVLVTIAGALAYLFA
jgi:hypothetical protein